MAKTLNPLGFSTGFFWKSELSEEQKIEQILEIEDEAIELGIGRMRYLERKVSKRAIEVMQTFAYRSIHAPNDIQYPSSDAAKAVEIVMRYAKQINAHTVLVHADNIADYEWVGDTFGSLLAIENTDHRRTFGKTVAEMTSVFNKLPSARFVFDANHVFTWDSTMKSAPEFVQKFAPRLVHYHLSGFGGTNHQCLFDTHEDIIFNGILDDAPIIIESVPEASTTLQQEYDYIKHRIHR